MTTYISHPNIAWRVAVVCDDEIHTYLAALFSSFYVDRDVSGLLAPEKTLTLYKTEDGYRIKNTDVVCTDLYRVLGTIMELLISPYFLRSRSYIYLHGAALVKNGRLVTIIAPTQQGKSTATALFVMRGYKYLSDDVIPVNIDTLEVSSFPKALCIRDLSIIKDGIHHLHQIFNVLPFHVKSEDNISKTIETRTPLLPFETVKACEKVSYKKETVFFLERTTQLNTDRYELSQTESGAGYLYLIRNLRASEQISLFRSVGAQLTRTARFVKLKYSKGYQYLNGFEGITDEGARLFQI